MRSLLSRTRTKPDPSGGDENTVEDVQSIDELLDGVADLEDEEEVDASQTRQRKRVAPWTRAYRGTRQRWRAWTDRAPRDASQWTGGNKLATRAATGALYLALGAGVVAFGQNVLESDQPVTQASGFDQRMMNRQGTASSAAAQFVPAWLSATADSSAELRRWWPDVSEVDLPSSPTTVADVSVLRAEASAPGVWTVVVGADVSSAKDTNVVTRRYYQVPVAVSGSKAVAAKPLALPAEIPPPSTAVDTRVQYPNRVSPAGAAMTTTRGFLAALLAGQGDIRLYERPGTWIPPLTPAPADRITVKSLLADSQSAPSVTGTTAPTDGQTANVLATVSLQAGDQPRTMQYVLHLAARDGRWEVVSVTGPPAMPAPQQTGGSP